MDKVFELLGVEKLDESTQNQVKEKLNDIIEVKASELMEGKLKEEKDKLIQEYEDKFEEYKNDITSKFSNFVDSVLEEEMNIPEKIVEYARKGELYSELIEQFKTRLAIDEGLLDEEVKGLLREAKDEIVSLRESLDEKTSKELELQSDAQEMAAALYLREKCDGLTDSQRNKVVEIMEGITDKEEIDRKFNVILDTVTEQTEEEEEEEEDDKDDKDDKDKKVDEGKGVSEVETKEEKDDGPFDNYITEYLNVMKEGV